MKYSALLLTIAMVEAMNLQVLEDEQELIPDMEENNVNDIPVADEIINEEPEAIEEPVEEIINEETEVIEEP